MEAKREGEPGMEVEAGREGSRDGELLTALPLELHMASALDVPNATCRLSDAMGTPWP